MESIEAPLPTMLPSEVKRAEELDWENLRLLSSFVKPLSAEERAEREQAYQSGREGGYLTQEMIMRVLLGEFS